MAIVDPTIVELCEKVDCRYTLVVEASKRARQLVDLSLIHISEPTRRS